MPAPRSKIAPYFKGDNLSDFLKDYIAASTTSAVPDAEKCKNLPRYCASKVCAQVESIDEVDGTSWDDLVKALTELFESRDHKKRYTVTSLDTYISTEGPKVKDRKTLDEYYLGYLVRAKFLIKEKKLTNELASDKFIDGLPQGLKDNIATHMKAVQGSAYDGEKTPTAKSVYTAAQQLLNDKLVTTCRFDLLIS